MENPSYEPFKEAIIPEVEMKDFEKPSLVKIAKAMEDAKTEEEMKGYVNNFLESFPETFHADLSPDVTSVYRAMEEEGLLVRLERLSAVIEDVLEHKPIRIGEGGDHYANAVLPNNEGIKIAFAEGMAPGPIRLLMGFEVRSGIGFDAKGLEVSEIDVSEFDLRDTSLRAALCRHVKGDILSENIKYLVLRLPAHLVEDRYVTEKELENASQFIFRGAAFNIKGPSSIN